MISIYPLFEFIPAPLAANMAKQALIWGGSSALAAKIGNKAQTPEQKSQLRRQMLLQGVIGAGAGALGATV